jgi:hypothetical protein
MHPQPSSSSTHVLILCPSICHAYVCPEHLVPTLAHILLIPMACRGHGNTRPVVSFPCPRDTCPQATSKWLAPFIDGAYGVRYQNLKIVCMSLFREANKGWQWD